MLVDAVCGRSTHGVLDLGGDPLGGQQSRPGRLGAVYTPPHIATWLAREVVRRLPAGGRRLVVDPACGDGALLAAVAREDASVDLVGLDIDERAARAAHERLDGARVVHADALDISWTVTETVVSGIVANPPWGAELLHSRAALSAAGYTLATGQFDSYELFIERAIQQLPVGGVAGFLVPDSLLLPEHHALRRLLLQRTRLELLVRLGEGIFDGVYRGTIAVVFTVGPATPDHVVRCCRVRDADRRRILAGAASLADVVDQQGHDIRQAHFASNDATMDVDATEDERATFARMAAQPSVWTPWLRAFRGVEIGKAGLVALCPRCREARPLRRPAGQEAGCESCGSESPAGMEAIIRPRESDAASSCWHPVLAGEDVQRYSVALRREIRLGVAGIRYKERSIFDRPKLLVRKTGVGLHAAFDDSGALTTQTVFHFLPTAPAPAFALHYVLGVLNSRIMLAYHLKRHGDVEWRSHPYVTPTMLAALPVPLPVAGTQRWRQAVAIAAAVRDLLTAPEEEKRSHDLRIERLVAALFDFDDAECRRVDEILGQAQQMQAIAALRLLPEDELYPLEAA